MTSYDRHYYDGDWQVPSTRETIAVISSASEEAVARVPRGTADDVERKILNLRPASKPWRGDLTQPGVGVTRRDHSQNHLRKNNCFL